MALNGRIGVLEAAAGETNVLLKLAKRDFFSIMNSLSELRRELLTAWWWRTRRARLLLRLQKNGYGSPLDSGGEASAFM